MTPIRPVSEDHRHEPADYELEPNELAGCPFCGGKAERRDDPGVCDVPFGLVVDHKEGCFFLQPYASTDDEFIAAWNRRSSLTQAPRSCCEDERERCAKIAETWRDENKASKAKAAKRGDHELAAILDGAAIECNAIATAIRSNSHDG